LYKKDRAVDQLPIERLKSLDWFFEGRLALKPNAEGRGASYGQLQSGRLELDPISRRKEETDTVNGRVRMVFLFPFVFWEGGRRN